MPQWLSRGFGRCLYGVCCDFAAELGVLQLGQSSIRTVRRDAHSRALNVVMMTTSSRRYGKLVPLSLSSQVILAR